MERAKEVQGGATALARGGLGGGEGRVHPRVRLTWIDGTDRHRPVEVDVPRFFIGRNPHCHLCLDSPFVSRVHALIERRDGRVFVRDLETTNGTVLNGRTFYSDKAELADGDQLLIGTHLFAVEIDRREGEERPRIMALEETLDDAGDVHDPESTPLLRGPSGTPSRLNESGPVSLEHLSCDLVQGIFLVTVRHLPGDDEPTVARVRSELETLLGRMKAPRAVICFDRSALRFTRFLGMLREVSRGLRRDGGSVRLCFA